MECVICKKTSNLKECSKCRVTQYCSQQCQKIDWTKHKKVCFVLQDKKYVQTTDPGKKIIVSITSNAYFTTFLHAILYHYNQQNTGVITCIFMPYGKEVNKYYAVLSWIKNTDNESKYKVNMQYVSKKEDYGEFNLQLEEDKCKLCYGDFRASFIDTHTKKKYITMIVSNTNYCEIVSDWSRA